MKALILLDFVGQALRSAGYGIIFTFTNDFFLEKGKFHRVNPILPFICFRLSCISFSFSLVSPIALLILSRLLYATQSVSFSFLSSLTAFIVS